METYNDIVQLLFDLQKICFAEVIQIDEKNNTYGITFQDRYINNILKIWYQKQELLKSGKLSEANYTLWQAQFPDSLVNDSKELLNADTLNDNNTV